ANADGSDARQITYLPGASFAPFFFPSGERIIFSSNYLNPRSAEFDLFAINIDGTGLEQITFSGGFDGFPVFSPDGNTLAFSSNRRDEVNGMYRATGTPAGKNDTNVFLADWVEFPVGDPPPGQPETAAANRAALMVEYLADDAREGRGVGTKGLDDALTKVQEVLERSGVEPGVEGGWRQSFDVITQVKRGAATRLELDGKPIADAELAPSAASANATAAGSLVRVGWGIVDAEAKRDDYKGKNVKGKIAVVHRFVPGDLKSDPKTAVRLGDLRYKAFTAKNKGAVALLVVDDGDLEQDEAPLPTLTAAESESSIPIVVLSRKAAAGLETGTHKAKLTVALEPVRTKTANLAGVIRAGAAAKQAGAVVIGAHIDHLGMGGPNALDPSVNAVHNGADDNASGIAALVEVAAQLATRKAELVRDVYIVAFSAEEMGVLGSSYFVKHLPTKDPIVAMINMDMVGRMRMSQLHVNGGDSAKEWKEIVAPACANAKLNCTIGGSGYGPSDHMPFYIAGVPVLFMFTGNHRDYHTANDDAGRINAIGIAQVASVAADVAFNVATRASKLTYVKAPPEAAPGGDMRRRGGSLGTVPSYGEDPNQPKGVLLSDVVPDGPAQKAGLKGGDLIVQIGTTEIANVNDLMFVLTNAKPGEATTITYVRNGKTHTVNATFGAPRGKR
ncbi:MAG: M20/M25/M40 family metallo-hydrolase, partial [Kofleriaceae bacterium]